jgi:PAS domain S-box-containing protein
LVRHTLRAQITLQKLLSEFDRIESNQRGYLLAGESSYFTQSKAAIADADRDIAAVMTLTHGNPSHLRLLAKVRELLDSTSFTPGASGTTAFGPNAFEGGAVASRMMADTQSMNSLRLLVATMYEEEESLLRSRTLDFDAAKARFQWAVLLGCALILCVVGTAGTDARELRNRNVAAELRNDTLNAELDDTASQRTALIQTRESVMDTFVRDAPAAVAMFDRDMRYLHISERWCHFFGLDTSQMIGHSLYEISPEMPERWKAIHQRCLAGDTMRAEEDRWDNKQGTAWLRWEITPWGQQSGLPQGLLIWAEDITSRRHTEEMLRESVATTRTLLDTASQAILVVNTSGNIVVANRMVGAMFGYAPADLLDRHREVLVPLKLREQHRAFSLAFFADPKPCAMHLQQALMGLRKDGSEFPIELNLSFVETEQGMLAVSFISDITVRTQTENALRDRERELRALTGSLISALEDERRSLARELHDDIMQRLAFLSIELGNLGRALPDTNYELLTLVATLQNQTIRASSEVRRMSHGLHPSVITDFGLSTALEEFCEEFERVRGIRVIYEGGVDDTCLTDSSATCLYRVAEESMRNAVIHGRATEIQVVLTPRDKSVQLQVRDNGVGFSTGRPRSKTSLGIISMTERTRFVNGTLNLCSQPGHGAEITAIVPFEGIANGSS